MIFRFLRRLLLIVAVIAIVIPRIAQAHPEGFSGLHLTIDDGMARAALTMHTRDLGTWFPPGKFPDYVAGVCAEIERSIDDIVELQWDSSVVARYSTRVFLLEVGLIEVDVTWTLPSTHQRAELLIWSKQLQLMPRGHQQLLFIEDRRGLTLPETPGKLLLDDMLTVEHDAGAAEFIPLKVENLAAQVMSAASSDAPIALDQMSHPSVFEQASEQREREAVSETSRQPKRDPAGTAPRKISFFTLGVEHILTGYDHLLFLAALLLTCQSLSEATKIITCFTVAHSITLALAALNVVQLDPGLVEPAIAASIVCVALENLVTTTPPLWRRITVTFGFGLIHGLGFASVLRDIGLGSVPGGVVWPLLRFNLGVEFGQLCVATLFFQLLWAARNRPSIEKHLVRGGSVLIAACGSYWLVTRVLWG